MWENTLLNLLFSVDYSTQNLLELTIFDITEILTLSISNCLSECLPKYSAFLFSPNPKGDCPGPVLKRNPLGFVCNEDGYVPVT